MDVELITPFSKQLEVITALDDPHTFYVVLVAGRQAGKTILAECQAIKWCLENANITVMWVSPTDNQCNKVFKEIINKFPKSSGFVKKKKGAKGDTEIVFSNNSQILFRSAGSKDTLRGNSVHYLILDEAAFIQFPTIEDVILPTLNVTGRKVFALSTPLGKNYFYDWFSNGQNREFDKWQSFKFTCYDSPYINQDIIEGFRETMTDIKFRQEILADFVDNASVFKNIDECMTMEHLNAPISGGNYYAGVDVGLLTDATVLSVIDNYGNLVTYYRWEEKTAQDVIDNIIDLNERWKFRRIFFETNNHGLPMYQTLRKTLSNIEDINTSSKTKPQMINRLIYLFDTKTIRIVKDSYLRTELEAFNYKQSDTGTVKYGAASGFHDDCVMSLAIARDCYERSRYNPRYVGFF